MTFPLFRADSASTHVDAVGAMGPRGTPDSFQQKMRKAEHQGHPVPPRVVEAW
jgi:hypothetical protein